MWRNNETVGLALFAFFLRHFLEMETRRLEEALMALAGAVQEGSESQETRAVRIAALSVPLAPSDSSALKFLKNHTLCLCDGTDCAQLGTRRRGTTTTTAGVTPYPHCGVRFAATSGETKCTLCTSNCLGAPSTIKQYLLCTCLGGDACRRGRKTRHPGMSCNTMLELPYASGRGTDSSAAYEFFYNVGKYPDGTRPRLGFCASCADMKLADIYPRSPAKVVRSAQKVPAAQTGEPTAELGSESS